MSASSKQSADAGSGVEARLRGALWGFFSGDAMSAPTHWYYGGFPQICGDYGRQGITDYTKPVYELPGSILNKSSTNGGGRGSFTRSGTSIIGDVINHGKRELWDPKKAIHYHATLKKGENTLEAQLARVLMKSVVANKGVFVEDHFRKAFIAFMTTPGSHNDTYASTCHRMFFANLIFHKKDPKDCPDNDGHNVDAIDGLILPTITALAVAASPGGTQQQASEVAARTAAVTRKSSTLEGVGRVWGGLVFDSVREKTEEGMTQQLNNAAKNLGLRSQPSASRSDQMVACYLSSSVPPLLDMIAKYTPKQDVWTGVVANANVGGENVHRGSILGAILGARAGMQRLPERLVNGLCDKEQLAEEIDQFVAAVIIQK